MQREGEYKLNVSYLPAGRIVPEARKILCQEDLLTKGLTTGTAFLYIN
jgi:hypothetical protein